MPNPIEPPPFSVRYKRPMTMPPARAATTQPDYLSDRWLEHANGIGASMSESPSQTAQSGYLRYDLGDGQGMREYRRSEPENGTLNFGTMTAPQNVDRVTFSSQMEDLDIANTLAGRRRELQMMQPYEQGMRLPPRTVGEMVQLETAQQTLRRLEEKERAILAQRDSDIQAGSTGALTSDEKATLRSNANDDAWRAYQRALMAEQLAIGKGLPGSVYDRRY